MSDALNKNLSDQFETVLYKMDEKAKAREKTNNEALKEDINVELRKMDDTLKEINDKASAHAEYIEERKSLENDQELLNKSFNAPIRNEDDVVERAYREATVRFNMDTMTEDDKKILSEGPFNQEKIFKRQLDDDQLVHFGFIPSLECTDAERNEGLYRLRSMSDLQYRTLTTTATNGGRLVHPRLSNQISAKILEQNPILNEVKVVMDGANQQYIEIIEDTEMGIQQAPEGSAATPATPADTIFGRVTMTKHAIRIVNSITVETLMWSVPDIEAFLNQASARKFAQELGNKHMTYNADNIHGIVGNPRFIQLTGGDAGDAANNASLTRTAANTTATFREILAAKYGLIQEIRRMPNVKCYVSDDQMQALESHSESGVADGALLFRRGFDGIGGAPATVLGKRVVECPSMGSLGSNRQNILFFSDLKMAYTRVVQPGMYQFKEEISDQNTSGVRFVRKIWEAGEGTNTQYMSGLWTPYS